MHVPHRRAPISIVNDYLVSAVGEQLHHEAAVPTVGIPRPSRIHARTGAKHNVLPLWLRVLLLLHCRAGKSGVYRYVAAESHALEEDDCKQAAYLRV